VVGAEVTTVSAAEFSIRYPLFALKRGGRDYIALELRLATPEGHGLAIPVFTTESKAAKYLGCLPEAGQIQVFDREFVFRMFLRGFRDTEHLIAFDPEHRGEGRTRFGRVYPAAVVEERFLSESWGWVYPMYAMYGWGGYHCLTARHKGVPMKAVVVLTDADLADREVAVNSAAGLVAVPIESREEFARFLRALPADVGGVLFDPPTDKGDWNVRGTVREQLIADLEATI
jgi:hypothetical protein